MANTEELVRLETLKGFAEALSNENIAVVGAESTSSGGVAGDQLGGELSIRPWYLHGAKWAKVYRLEDPVLRNKMARFMEDAIINGWVGYSQDNYDEGSVDGSTRHSFHRQLKLVGYNPNRVTASCGVDCSSLVYSAVRHAIGEDFRILGEDEDDIPTVTINGTTYCSDYHKCDKYFRTSNWLPTGFNFDWIFERFLPLMGYKVDVYTLPNKGVYWRWAWPSLVTANRFMEFADYEGAEANKITPYAYFGDKAFRVTKSGSTYSAAITNTIMGIDNYKNFVNQSRICHSPYDYITSSMKNSIDAFNNDYIGSSDYVAYAVNTNCATPFDAYIEYAESDTTDELKLLKANKLIKVGNEKVAEPNGSSTRQVYQLVYHDGTPVIDDTGSEDTPVYCAFFDQEDDKYSGYDLLGVNMDSFLLQRLQNNLKVHVHGQNGFNAYDYFVNGNALERGDIVRTRGYSGLKYKYRWQDDEAEPGTGSEDTDTTTESYFSSSGHIAIWV